MPLSDAKIRTLKPADKDFKTADTGGLFLLMKASGSKSWRMKYRLEQVAFNSNHILLR